MLSRVLTLLETEKKFPLTGNDPYYIHHGECVAFLRSLPDSCIDGIYTDPPYCSGGRTAAERTGRSTTEKYTIGGSGRAYEDFEGDSRDQRAFLLWAQIWLGECYRVAKPGATICLFTDWRQLATMTDALQLAGFVFRGIAVWDKTGGCRPTKGRFAHQAEFIVWGSKGKMPVDRDAPTLPGVFTFPVKSADKHHLTGKPTPMTRETLRIVERGGTILDPFCGSGTTIEAGLENGFKVIACEWSDHYAEVSRARAAATVERLNAERTSGGAE